MTERTFDEFTATRDGRKLPHSEWVRADGLRIYVRDGWHERQGDYVLANIENVRKWGDGSLTRFLDTYEHKFQFSVENILNPRLVSYFERRGYIRNDLPDMMAPHMIGPKPSEYSFRFVMSAIETARKKELREVNVRMDAEDFENFKRSFVDRIMKYQPINLRVAADARDFQFLGIRVRVLPEQESYAVTLPSPANQR